MSNPAHDDMFGDIFPDGPPKDADPRVVLAKLLGLDLEQRMKDEASALRDADTLATFANTITFPPEVAAIGKCKNVTARNPAEWAEICLVNIGPVLSPPTYKAGLTWEEAAEASTMFAVAVGLICRGKRILRGDPPFSAPSTP